MSEIEGRRVLVTGGGGFIGGHLVARLVEAGARVRALLHYNSRGDLGTLGWLDPVNPRGFVETNVIGTLNVAQAARGAGVKRVVTTSTSEVYGSAQFLPITEEHPLEAQSPYAASKIGADKVMESFQRSFDLEVTILRPFNTYGPHQSARAVIPTIISQALIGDSVSLGSLDPRRDLTYVSDTVEGFLAAATAPAAANRTFQLGTNRDVSVGEIVEMVGGILGRGIAVQHEEERVRPAASEVTQLLSSPALAKELTGWEPMVSLEEGLSRTIDYVRAHPDRFRPDRYAI
jgi:nucleoside-diphosphate-sugar epimerase